MKGHTIIDCYVKILPKSQTGKIKYTSVGSQYIENTKIQWRNDALPALAMLRGDVLRGHNIFTKMWDNFARLAGRLAKSCLLFNNLTIYLDFSHFPPIVPNRRYFYST